jgi:hypothetical protein
MAQEYLLDVDPVNRAINTFSLDGDTIIVRRYWYSEDVNAILDANARQRLDAPLASEKKPDFFQTERIPDIVHYQWLEQFGVRSWDKNHQKEVQRLLNSNEFSKLRTTNGGRY